MEENRKAKLTSTVVLKKYSSCSINPEEVVCELIVFMTRYSMRFSPQGWKTSELARTVEYHQWRTDMNYERDVITFAQVLKET